MKKNNYIYLLILLVAAVTFACHTSNLEPEDSYAGYDYYPLDTGRYVIYDVIDTSYTGSDTVISNYQLKEILEDTLHFGGQVWYRVFRFKRNTSADAWPSQPDSVWSVCNTGQQIVKDENNNKYIKLSFPLENNKEWDGNAQNVNLEDDYKLKSVGKSFTFDSSTYPSTVTVEQGNLTTFISKDSRIEVYAKDIGLVYKKWEVLAYKQDAQNITLYKIDFGKKYYLKAVSYGIE
jgi:hypothetical protein